MVSHLGSRERSLVIAVTRSRDTLRFVSPDDDGAEVATEGAIRLPEDKLSKAAVAHLEDRFEAAVQAAAPDGSWDGFLAAECYHAAGQGATGVDVHPMMDLRGDHPGDAMRWWPDPDQRPHPGTPQESPPAPPDATG